MNKFKKIGKVASILTIAFLLFTQNVVAAEKEQTLNNDTNNEITTTIYDYSGTNDNQFKVESNPLINANQTLITPDYSAVYYFNEYTTVNVAFNPYRLIPKQIHMNHPYYGPVQGTVYPINANEWNGSDTTWLYRGSLYRIDGSPMPISIIEER